MLDADALTSFAGEAAKLAALIARGGHAAVMTPHEGEFARLFAGARGVEPDDDKLARARAAARLTGAVVVLKGSDTVVAAPDGRASIGLDLPPTLATAGSGDVSDRPRRRARRAGHARLRGGLRRRLAARRRRQLFGPGLISEDLPEALPAVLRELGELRRRSRLFKRLGQMLQRAQAGDAKAVRS